MTTNSPTESKRSSRPKQLSATEIFPLLAARRRRQVLHHLCHRVGAVPLGELAEQIALREETPTRDAYERILTSLYHSHLPTLVDGGLVRYDVDREEVFGTDTIDEVRPYLELALADDLE